MPIGQFWDSERGVSVDRYYFGSPKWSGAGAAAMAYELDPDALLLGRQAAIRLREEWLRLKKACEAAGDREGARYFKAEASDALKLQRAFSLVIPWYVADPPGDSRDLTLSRFWPVELASQLDVVLRTCELGRGSGSAAVVPLEVETC